MIAIRPLALLRVVSLSLAVAACSATSTPPSAAAPDSPPRSSTAAAGPTPIVVDTDLAGDDLLALMALLREPAVDVRAIAVDGNGEVHCAHGVTNVRNLLRAFGREGIPVGCGRGNAGDHGRLFPEEWRTGADAFYGVQLPAADAESTAGAAGLIADVAAASAESLTIVALGPWSNIADAFAAHPELATRLAGIHAMAGAIDVPGNVALGDVTPDDGLEWNVAVDPDSVAAVLDTDVPVTLVPLDATNDVPVPADFATILEADHGAAGADIAFEMFARAPSLTVDTSFWDSLASMALVDPALVTWEDLTVTVDRDGRSAGRIRRAGEGRPVRAAMSADADAFRSSLLTALRRGDPRPEPFTLTGSLAVAWDGATCSLTTSGALAAGAVRLALANSSDAPVTVFLAAAKPPRTWSDVISFVGTVDVSDPNLTPPDWLSPIDGSATALAGEQAVAIASIPGAKVGAICATGEWPELGLVPSNAVDVAG